MVAGVSSVLLGAIDPHVRAIDGWRDGPAIADLLELAFQDEGIDDNGQRMIHMLRRYGPLEAIIMEGTPGFVWVEGGQVLGNASVQYNPARRGTWIVGNVATHPAHRNQGIGSALISSVIRYARSRGARTLALQVVEGNTPAVRLYEKFGFQPLGAVTYYQRPPVRVQAPWHDLAASGAVSTGAVKVHTANWANREAVWHVARLNIPDDLTYSDPFDASTYRLGLRWSMTNWLGGNREHWWVTETGGAAAAVTGALRVRINFDLSQHNVELLLNEQAPIEHGLVLLERGLRYLQTCIDKPLLATQSRPHGPSHEALQAAGFIPMRTLIHMKLEI